MKFPFFQKEDHKNVVFGTHAGVFWPRKEILTEAELNHHVHIVGASGYGKTVLLSHIIKHKIQTGSGLLYVDLKGDIETIETITRLAQENSREQDLQIFSISNPLNSSSYNLIGNGTATQLRDKIMQSLSWSEEYYKNQSASFLLKALIGLCWLRDHQRFHFSLDTLLKISTDSDYVAELANMIPEKQNEETGTSSTAPSSSSLVRSSGQSGPSRAFASPRHPKLPLEACYEFLSDKANYNSLQGLRTQLESLVMSDFGALLAPVSGGSEDGIDLFESIKESKITCIFLDTRRYGETAKTVGKFLLQDLKTTSARIDSDIPREQRKHFVCIIDEFADLAQEDFIGFLDRARSSKIAIVVAHQELSDLQRISPEFSARLTGNMSTMYAFLQKNPESAEMISGMAGTKKVWKETLRSEKFLFVNFPTGDKSLREVEEFNIHPNLIKSLRVGQCIAVKKYPHSRSYLMNVAYG